MPSPWRELKGQVFLGDEKFPEKLRTRLDNHQRRDVQLQIAHRRRPPPTLAQIEKGARDRDSANGQARATGA